MHLILTLVIILLNVITATSQTINQLPNDVVYVDLKFNDNLQRHHTSRYRQIGRIVQSHSHTGYSLVLRRGEQFNTIIHLRYPFNTTKDKLRLEFSHGPQPQLDKGTLFYLPLENDLKTDKSNLNAKLTQISGNKLHVQINFPGDMPVGVWRMKVSSKLAGSKRLYTYPVDEALYIIFNPWSTEDAVHMAREDGRQEYVLNEVGKIYTGSYNRPTGHRWTFGQFHEAVLPAIMYMLDKTRLDITSRKDVVRVSRAVSALVNSHDDNGLLVGNWSGNYGDGLAPWQWSGSATIFERYVDSGWRPVKFGQCWVFGGVTTTALRTLGIPARTISNYVSAHDTDLSLTVDEFYSERGAKITGINGDSIWNFHVWSDAWMERYDLPPGYGGWQAIDATPQETSMGKYQLGPASLEAIKQGRVGFAYDVGFVYSEVNADLVHWRPDPRSNLQWRKSQVQTAHVGRKMLTKQMGFLDDRTRFGVQDAEDIVQQYKYPEGSKEERLSYASATEIGGLSPIHKAP